MEIYLEFEIRVAKSCRPKDPFFNLIYCTDSIYKMYKDKLQNCSCNQFHYICTYKQVEKNSMTKNRGGNNGSEK